MSRDALVATILVTLLGLIPACNRVDVADQSASSKRGGANRPEAASLPAAVAAMEPESEGPKWKRICDNARRQTRDNEGLFDCEVKQLTLDNGDLIPTMELTFQEAHHLDFFMLHFPGGPGEAPVGFCREMNARGVRATVAYKLSPKFRIFECLTNSWGKWHYL